MPLNTLVPIGGAASVLLGACIKGGWDFAKNKFSGDKTVEVARIVAGSATEAQLYARIAVLEKQLDGDGCPDELARLRTDFNLLEYFARELHQGIIGIFEMFDSKPDQARIYLRILATKVFPDFSHHEEPHDHHG